MVLRSAWGIKLALSEMAKVVVDTYLDAGTSARVAACGAQRRIKVGVNAPAMVSTCGCGVAVRAKGTDIWKTDKQARVTLFRG